MFTRKQIFSLLFAGLAMLTLGVGPAYPIAAFDGLEYPGRLTDAAGIPVVDGSYDLNFSIFNQPQAGSPLWAESQAGVPVVGGAFKVRLGSHSPLPADIPMQSGWLEIAVRGPGEAGFTILSPRQSLSGLELKSPAASTAPNGLTCVHDHFGGEWSGNSADVNASAFYGLRVDNTRPDGYALGGFADGATGTGVIGRGDAGTGVAAKSDAGIGLYAFSNTGKAIMAYSDAGTAISVEGDPKVGVKIQSTQGDGLVAEVSTGTAVSARSESGYAVEALGPIYSNELSTFFVSPFTMQARGTNMSDLSLAITSQGQMAVTNVGDPSTTKLVVIPLTLPGELYGTQMKVKALEVCYMAETDAIIQNTRVRYYHWDDTAPEIRNYLNDNTDRTNNAGECYSVSVSNLLLDPATPITGSSWVEFMLKFSGNDPNEDVLYFNRIKLSLTEVSPFIIIMP